MEYKLLKQHIKAAGYKNPRDFCDQNGFPEIRHNIRWECLTIAKLTVIMEKLNLPVAYFFGDYQSLVAQNAYVEGQVTAAIAALNELPAKGEGVRKALKLLSATLDG